MRPVVLYSLLSLDGVAESPDRYVLDWDDDLDAHLADVIAAQDTVLLGRRMYEEWADHWPASDLEPFAPFINGVDKYVFTSSSLDRDWAHTTATSEPAVDVVARLRSEGGGTIGVHGSIRLAQSLLRAGQVDELRLVIAPVTAGTGRRLFHDDGETRRWDLAESTTSPSGALLLHYRHRP